MNVYEKLQRARVMLQKTQIKKSGHNPYANFSYFELQDFLPAVNVIFEELKLTAILKIRNLKAMLKILNCDNIAEYVIFECPFDKPTLKNANSIQNIGAGITYIRRYLMLIALDIVENDTLDALPKEREKEDKIEVVDIERLYNQFLEIEKLKNIPKDKIENISKVKNYYKEHKLKYQTLKNAIEYLTGLNDKETRDEASISNGNLAFKEGLND